MLLTLVFIYFHFRAPVFRTKNVSDVGSESVPDAMKHKKNPNINTASASVVKTPLKSSSKPRPKPVSKRGKAPISEKYVNFCLLIILQLNTSLELLSLHLLGKISE